jgi:hypothetical protein
LNDSAEIPEVLAEYRRAADRLAEHDESRSDELRDWRGERPGRHAPFSFTASCGCALHVYESSDEGGGFVSEWIACARAR